MCNRGQISKVARQNYGLGYGTAANGIASYIEMLQEKIDKLQPAFLTEEEKKFTDDFIKIDIKP